jgi:hypothetical protein
LQWATERIWEIVEQQCGIRRPKPDEAKSPDVVSRRMVFWFAAASEGNTAVNLLPLQAWKAPGWLARGDEQRDFLLEEHLGHLCLRLNQVIKDEIDAAEIRRAISRRDVTDRVVESGIRKRDAASTAQSEPLRRSLRQPRPEDATTLRFGVGARYAFVHSDDYRFIKFKGSDYVLTPNQSLAVQILYEALQQGLRGVSNTTLLERLGSPTSRLRDSFRSGDGPKLWNVLIVKIPGTKDVYSLNLS